MRKVMHDIMDVFASAFMISFSIYSFNERDQLGFLWGGVLTILMIWHTIDRIRTFHRAL